MKKIVLIFVVLISFTTLIYPIDVKEIIRNLDRNEVYNTIRYDGIMIIYNEGKKYEKTFKTYAKGNKNFFMEFTNQDDEGTKYMKKDGKLYVYTDDLEKVMPITGHMLKESMMGSDLSYEDTVENDKLLDQYDPVIINETKFDGKTKFKGNDVWIIKLIAKIPERININDFENRVVKKIKSSKKKERTVNFINQYYSKKEGIYILKNNLKDEDRIKIHYKLSALKYIKPSPYGKQIMWVDKERAVALKTDIYSASGKNKLKEIILLNAEDIGGRYFPIEIQMKNLLRKDSKTVFKMNSIKLDIDISDGMFSLKNLER